MASALLQTKNESPSGLKPYHGQGNRSLGLEEIVLPKFLPVLRNLKGNISIDDVPPHFLRNEVRAKSPVFIPESCDRISISERSEEETSKRNEEKSSNKELNYSSVRRALLANRHEIGIYSTSLPTEISDTPGLPFADKKLLLVIGAFNEELTAVEIYKNPESSFRGRVFSTSSFAELLSLNLNTDCSSKPLRDWNFTESSQAVREIFKLHMKDEHKYIPSNGILMMPDSSSILLVPSLPDFINCAILFLSLEIDSIRYEKIDLFIKNNKLKEFNAALSKTLDDILK